MTLRVPPSEAVADILVARDGIDRERALAAARAAQGHVGRARRLVLDPAAAARREAVLRVPVQSTSLGPALAAAAALVKTAEDEAKTVTEQLDEPEREAMRQAFGEGATGKGVAKAMRGMAGAMKDLEDRQKSRATRVKRDTLDGALLDLAAYYRDVLMVQLGVATSSSPTRTTWRTCGGSPRRARPRRRCGASRRSCGAGSGSPSTSRRSWRSRS